MRKSNVILGAVILCLWSGEISAQKVTFAYNPQRAVPVRYTQTGPGFYKSTAKANNLPQNVQAYMQEFENGPKLASPDAIRIIDPPKFFQDQKRFHYSQYQQQNGNAASSSPLVGYEIAAYSGPKYLPKQGRIPQKQQQQQQQQQPQQQQQQIKAHYSTVTAPQSQAYQGYQGLQTPQVVYVRPQIEGLREKQKIYFQTGQNDHPVRTKYQPNDDQPIYGHTIFKPEGLKYKPGKDEYVVGNTFTVTDNTGANPLQSNVLPYVPFKLLASVRHQNQVSQQPRQSLDPRAKEHLRTQKTYTVYSEQGYQDEEHNNGDEERQAIQYTQHRSKRSNKFIIAPTEVERVEELPIALSLVSNDGEKLAGQDLLQHIAGLIKSSKQLQLSTDQKPESQNLDSIVLQRQDLQELFQKSVKVKQSTQPQPQSQKLATNHQTQKLYLPINPTNPNAPRAEKLQSFRKSPYQQAKPINCDYNVDPNFQQNDKKKKLGNAGQQIDCLKVKYFGKDPLSNKFFQEQYIVPNQPQTQQHETSTTKNPSLLVYKDVMQTIESSKNSLKHPYERSQYGLDNNPDTALYPDAVLPIFDITQYFSQVYMIKPNGKVYGISFKSNPGSEENTQQQFQEPAHQASQPTSQIKQVVQQAVQTVIQQDNQPRPQQYQETINQEHQQQRPQYIEVAQQPKSEYQEVRQQPRPQQYQVVVHQEHQQSRPHYQTVQQQRPPQYQEAVRQEHQKPRQNSQSRPQSHQFQEVVHLQQQYIQHPQTLQQTRAPVKTLRFHYEDAVRHQGHQRQQS